MISKGAGGYTGPSGGSAPAPFAVVRVPFPFIDRIATKNRPALVLSDAARFNVPTGHSVLAMITSAGNPPGLSIARSVTARLRVCPTPSKVRMKLFTLDNRPLRGALGHLAEPDERRVRAALMLLLPVG